MSEKLEYTIDKSTINAINSDKVKYQIKIIDSTHLEHNGNIYTYDNNGATITQAYIDTITDDDISTAIEFINEYLSTQKQYKYFKDIQIIYDFEAYRRDTLSYYPYYECPAKMIVIRYTTIGVIDALEQIQETTLIKETSDSEWSYRGTAIKATK